MKQHRKLVNVLIATTLSLSIGGTAFARSSNHGPGLSSEQSHERLAKANPWQPEHEGRAGDENREHNNHESIQSRSQRFSVEGLSAARWTVSDVIRDSNNRVLGIRHVVPIKDMPVYGAVANVGLASTGVKIARVEARYAAADSDLGQPHYHFTQWLSVPR
jgi:hypothetical protein